MRTKLRLDLKDVRKQIEDMEELLKTDNSPENQEAHAKLVEYEKKLQDQYEKMTGLSVDQANNLEEKTKEEKKKKSKLSAIFGLLGGILIAYGFYNTVLHSVGDFAPTAILDYFTGNGSSVESLQFFMTSILYGDSVYFIILPIGIGTLFALLGGMVNTEKSAILGLIEGFGFILTSGLLFFILFSSPDAETGVSTFMDYLLYFSIGVLVGGFFIFIAGITNKGIFSKILGASVGILFIYSGVQYYLLTTIGEEATREQELVYQWPWITVPILLAGIIYSLNKFIAMLK